DRLVNEIAGLRGLMALAGMSVDVPKSTSVKLSDLEQERDALAQELMALQADLETRDDDASKALNAKIWMHLMATAMARMPTPPDFPDPDA
ncbi:MAG: hypothetical protein VXW22_12330, partial [Pseudomonadota bacterium]|nr:hypothetical protein [Pseudomonadota bacterium]